AAAKARPALEINACFPVSIMWHPLRLAAGLSASAIGWPERFLAICKRGHRTTLPEFRVVYSEKTTVNYVLLGRGQRMLFGISCLDQMPERSSLNSEID